MTMVTITSQQFNRDVSAAKRAADTNGPVYITNRGRVTHVLVRAEDYPAKDSQKPRETLEHAFSKGLSDEMQEALDALFDSIPPRGEEEPRAYNWLDDLNPAEFEDDTPEESA
jgi:PHD/YefM family antitoxin component YafN of YafNO toxin-antitoxin module